MALLRRRPQPSSRRSRSPVDLTPANDVAAAWPATPVERRIEWAATGVLARVPPTRLAGAIVEFVVFGLKQGWACLFGGLMVGLILLTAVAYPADAALARYDFLFLAALAVQAGMLALRLETVDEAKVILVYHIVGTAMEVFKTAQGSWIYPHPSLFHIGAVPLFTGFMYAAIGSYIARCFRLFDFGFTGYPPRWATVALALAIYVNFFSHHYLPDVRLGLFGAVIVLFGRTHVHFRVFRFRHRMPLTVGFLLVALFIWLAENIGTLTGTWAYPGQVAGWPLVSLGKLGSWYLLMIISFVLVTLVSRPRLAGAAQP